MKKDEVSSVDDQISRQAAIDALDDEITITGKSNAYVVKDYVQRVKRKLEKLPFVEPEIIRCRDCEHWDKSWVGDWKPNCHYCSMIDRVCGENWYCADAERRTDEGSD